MKSYCKIVFQTGLSPLLVCATSTVLNERVWKLAEEIPLNKLKGCNCAISETLCILSLSGWINYVLPLNCIFAVALPSITVNGIFQDQNQVTFSYVKPSQLEINKWNSEKSHISLPSQKNKHPIHNFFMHWEYSDSVNDTSGRMKLWNAC